MKKTYRSLKWNVVLLFTLFSIILYLLIWFTQAIMTNFIYRSVKVKSIRELQEELVEVIQDVDVAEPHEFYKYREVFMENVNSAESDVWIIYYDNYNGSINIAYANKYFSETPTICIESWNEYHHRLGEFTIKDKNSYAKGEIINDKTGKTVMLFISTEFTFFDVTQRVFSSQFIIITIIVFIMSIAFAVIMHHKIVKPIASITKGAQELAKGNYDAKFEAEGYLEIEELSDTLNYAANELSKLDGYQKELMANVSHDLRTPLTLISGYSEMMRDYPGERTEENLQVIVDESKRLTKLVNDIISLTKIQTSNNDLEKESFNLTDSIKDIVYRQEKLIEELNIKIVFEFEEEVNIFANQEQLEKVIYNYINNAINYVGLDKTVIVKQIVENDYVKISVIDHGVGISEEELPNIWDRYYKAKTHKRATIGSGLGLSIVKTVLEKQGFEYGVNSKLNEGSEFWFKTKIYKEN
ncbi:MAG: HAMP domain-containing histidine kinase [Bacilli bacterium]|nr:HAMP domain-containing histidine kinase [Bacilli bacterium]